MIRETIKSLFTRGSFTQDVAIVGSGKVLVTIIGLIFIPILSRIYDPEAYGLFSIYIATVTLIVGILTLNYTNAFVIIKEEKTFIHIFLFTVSSIIIGSFLIFISLPLIQLVLSKYLQSLKFLYLIPIGIIINGLVLILIQTNLRRRQFLFSASINVGNHLIIRFFNLIYGIITKGYNIGLILGNQIGGAFSILSNGIKNFQYISKLFKTHYSNISLKTSLLDYKNYPLFIFPNSLLNNVKIQAPIYFLGFVFGKSLLGEYSMAIGLLNVPIQIIGGSISGVFMKKASDIYNNQPEKLHELTSKTTSTLFILSFIPFSILLVFGTDILNVLLGENWVIAGTICSIFAIYFFLYIVFLPSTALLQIYKKEKTILVITVLNVTMIIIVLISSIFSHHFIATIVLLSLSNALIVIIQGYIVYKLLDLNFAQFILKIFFSFMSLSGFLWIIKYFIQNIL